MKNKLLFYEVKAKINVRSSTIFILKDFRKMFSNKNHKNIKNVIKFYERIRLKQSSSQLSTFVF